MVRCSPVQVSRLRETGKVSLARYRLVSNEVSLAETSFHPGVLSCGRQSLGVDRGQPKIPPCQRAMVAG